MAFYHYAIMKRPAPQRGEFFYRVNENMHALNVAVASEQARGAQLTCSGEFSITHASEGNDLIHYGSVVRALTEAASGATRSGTFNRQSRQKLEERILAISRKSCQSEVGEKVGSGVPRS